jgi:dUTP pyrophosphatase
MIIKVINKSSNPLPHYESPLSAGLDIRAFLEESIFLKPRERALVKTGLYIELEKNYEAQVRPRSGIALKKRDNGIEFTRNNRCRL